MDPTKPGETPSNLKRIFGAVTVEPVAYFTFCGLAMYQLIRDTGLYRTVCERDNSKLTVDCDHPDTQIEDELQKRATLWIMAYSLGVLLPAMLADLLLGAWGDRRGRKPNMLLGISGTILAVVPLIAVLTFPTLPIYTSIFANVICGSMGSSAIVMVSSYAYLADHETEHDLLTVRMTVLSVCISTALISGNYFTGLILERLSLQQTGLITIAVLVVGFIYCLLRIPDETPSSNGRPKPVEQRESDSLLGPKSGRFGCTRGCCPRILRYAKDLLAEVWQTYSKPRRDNHRAYILVGVWTFLIVTMADFQGNVITLYVYRRPLLWTPTELATWKACTGVMYLLGGLVAALLFKRLLRLRDTTIILIGMCSAAAQNACLAMSTSTWMMYTASATGLFAQILLPCVCSLTTRLVSKDEIGKTFAGFTLSAECALILSVALLNTIYQSTVDVYPGLVFFFVAALVLLTMVPMAWVHFSYREEGLASNPSDNSSSSSNIIATT